MFKFRNVSLLLLALAGTSSGVASAAEAGYYVGGRVISAAHKANNMASSARPGIGAFVPERDKDRSVTGSLALGYEFGNGWRAEGEYAFPKTDTFVSGSTAFPASSNVNDIRSQRLMANVYRDFAINDQWSVFASAGLGIARLKSEGWQGIPTRTYNAGRQDNLAWSLGTGVAWKPLDRLTLELGYRYVDMGRAESGWNAFTNARSLQDEMMRADVVSSEIHLGARYGF